MLVTTITALSQSLKNMEISNITGVSLLFVVTSHILCLSCLLCSVLFRFFSNYFFFCLLLFAVTFCYLDLRCFLLLFIVFSRLAWFTRPRKISRNVALRCALGMGIVPVKQMPSRWRKHSLDSDMKCRSMFI